MVFYLVKLGHDILVSEPQVIQHWALKSPQMKVQLQVVVISYIILQGDRRPRISTRNKYYYLFSKGIEYPKWITLISHGNNLKTTMD